MIPDRRADQTKTLKRTAGAGFFLLLVVAIIWSWHSLVIAQVFTSQSQDTGNMWQTIWNVSHGHGFTMTFSNTGEQISRLAIHADYFLVLLAPLGWIGRAEILPILQAMAVVAGAWFLWSAVVAISRRPNLAYAVAASYLLAGAVYYPVLWQTHSLTFIYLFGLAGLEAIIRRRRFWLVVMWFGLAVLTKENVGILFGPVWYYFLRANGQSRRGWWFLAIGAFWTLIHFFWLIPAARNDGSTHFAWNLYYRSLGDTPSEQLSALLRGAEWLRRLWVPDHALTTILMTLPMAGLALVSPVALLMFPAVLPHWLGDTYSIHTVYHIAHIPAMIIGLAAVFDALRRSVGQRFCRWRWAPLVLLTCGIAASVLSSPYPWSLAWQPSTWEHDPGLATMISQHRRIPRDASISFTRELGAQFRGHQYSAQFPQAWTTVDYLVIYEPVVYNLKRNTDKNVYQWYRDFLDQSAAFETVYQAGTSRIYRRLPGVKIESVPNEYLPRNFNFY